jgi:hypothetical protein
MRDLTVNVSVSSFDTGDTVSLSAVVVRNNTNITYVLSDVVETSSEALFLDINWGDGTPVERYTRHIVVYYRTSNIIDEIVYNKPLSSILTSKKHTYYNNTNSFNISVMMQMLITYKDNSILKIRQPIQIFQASYYDDIGDLDILSAQIMPLSTNNTFINLESKLSKHTYVVALDTYSDYINSPVIIDDNTVEGCGIIDVYKDYELPYYDT